MKFTDLKNKLEDSVEYLKGELSQIRTGRVTPSLLDKVKVDAYGSDLSIKEVGTVNVLDAQTLQISPWDKNLLEPIEKAIQGSDLNLNPVVKPDSVLVPIPSLTEERRKEFTVLVTEKVEEVKTTIRHLRQDTMKTIDDAFDKKEFGEDEKFALKEEVEEIVKNAVDKIEKIGDDKKSDLMKI